MNTPIQTVREALAARNLDEYAGEYAVYEDVYQCDGNGRDFADYMGSLHHQHTTPRAVVYSATDAARLLDEIRRSGTLGGVRYGRIEYRANIRRQKGGVTHVSSGRPESGVVICKITRHGYDAVTA